MKKIIVKNMKNEILKIHKQYSIVNFLESDFFFCSCLVIAYFSIFLAIAILTIY